jgi:hypothetical protein
MGIVQVIIDRTTSMNIEGTYQFDRVEGGTLVAPSGESYPGTPVAGEWFWRIDQGQLYRRNNTNTAWDAVGGGAGGYVTEPSHAALRQLIHLADKGPMEGWATGAYRETLPAGNAFPTSIIWWTSAGKTAKIVAKLVTYNSNKTPATIQWSAYASDGTTVVAQVTDTIAYSGVFETSRTRAVT